MAHQCRSSKKSKLEDDNDLVNWVLKDRNKDEENSDFTWRPYAAKLEPRGSLVLNLGVEEQAMVIIKRHLTVEAQRKANESSEAAKKKAVANKSKKETAEAKAKAKVEEDTAEKTKEESEK